MKTNSLMGSINQKKHLDGPIRGSYTQSDCSTKNTTRKISEFSLEGFKEPAGPPSAVTYDHEIEKESMKIIYSIN
jgi:hypothetical protein